MRAASLLKWGAILSVMYVLGYLTLSLSGRYYPAHGWCLHGVNGWAWCPPGYEAFYERRARFISVPFACAFLPLFLLDNRFVHTEEFPYSEDEQRKIVGEVVTATQEPPMDGFSGQSTPRRALTLAAGK